MECFIKFLSKYHCACRAEHISCTAFFDFATAAWHIEKCPCKGIRNVPGKSYQGDIESKQKRNIFFFSGIPRTKGKSKHQLFFCCSPRAAYDTFLPKCTSVVERKEKFFLYLGWSKILPPSPWGVSAMEGQSCEYFSLVLAMFIWGKSFLGWQVLGNFKT